MGTSPDVGGSRGMGRPQQLDYTEQQQTAQVVNLKAGMGMVDSALEIPLHLVGGERYQYEAHSARPNLDTKVLVSVARPDSPEKNPAEEAEYQEILDKLPLQLSLQLQDDNKKPWEERNPKFIVFEIILRFVAKARVWLESVSDIDASQHVSSRSKTDAFPKATLRGWVVAAERILGVMKSSPAPSFMTPAGVRDVKTNFTLIKRLIPLAKEALAAKVGKRGKVLKRMEKELMLLSAQVKTKKIGGLFRMTEALIDELVIITGTLRKKTSASSLMGWLSSCVSLVGGKHLHAVMALICEGRKDTGYYQQTFLPKLLTLTAGLFPALVLYASGKRSLAEKNDPRLEKDAIQSLAMRLAGALIAHSKVVPYLGEGVLEELDVPKEAQTELLAASEILAFHLLLLAAESGGKEIPDASPLLSSLKMRLAPLLKRIIERVKSQGESKQLKEIGIALRQADIALKHKEGSSGYFEGLKKGLSAVNIAYDDIAGESLKATKVASQLLNGIHETHRQTDFTKMVVQAA